VAGVGDDFEPGVRQERRELLPVMGCEHEIAGAGDHQGGRLDAGKLVGPGCSSAAHDVQMKASQAKTSTRHHSSSRASVVTDHATREIDPLDWVIPGPSETSAPGLGLLTDLMEELLGSGGLLNGG
jgi:hypothetical protein